MGQAYEFYRTHNRVKVSVINVLHPSAHSSRTQQFISPGKAGESKKVDHYAQQLQNLLGRLESEGFGRVILAYQFVPGLTPSLRTKVAGVEGSFEQQARLKEAKVKELTLSQSREHRVITSDASDQQRNTTNSTGGRRQGGTVRYVRMT